MLRVFWVLAMLDVGLNATRNTIGAPFVIPPFTPPAPFFTKGNASLCSEPFIRAASKPSPNSIPRTPGMEKTACETSDSTELKKGSPSPAGTPSIRHSTIPPRESPSRAVTARRSGHFSLSFSPPISFRQAEKANPHCFFAMTPAATMGRVILPEK